MANTRKSISAELPPSREDIVAIVSGAIERRQPPEEPFELASGATSWVYADVKYPLSRGKALRAVGSYALARLREAGVKFSAVGGLTMGATPLAIAISMAPGSSSRHFEVCKEPDTRYSLTNPLPIVGTRFVPGDRILVTEDATSTGGSAEKAITEIRKATQHINDVEVVGVCTVLDRGRAAAELFTAQGLAFIALTTYKDFGLEPIN